MKKSICILLALFALLICLPTFAATEKVPTKRISGDYKLSNDQEQEISDRLKVLTKEFKIGLGIRSTTISDIYELHSDSNTEEMPYAQWVMEKEGIGYGKKNSAAMLFVTGRDFRLYVHGNGKEAFTEEYIEYVEKSLELEYDASRDYFDAFTLYMDLCTDIMSANRSDTVYEIPSEPHPPRLIDNAGLLSDHDFDIIIEKLDTYSTEANFDIVICTVAEGVGDAAWSVAKNYYDSHNYGMGDTTGKDGIMLFISVGSGIAGERKWATYTTEGFSFFVFDDATLNDIEDEVLEYLGDSDYTNAFLTFADRCYSTLRLTNIKQGESIEYYDHLAEEYDRKNEAVLYIDGLSIDGVWFIISPIGGIIIAFIILAIMKRKMRSVRMQPDANSYVKPGSFCLTENSDTFLYRNVSRTRRVTENSSGGGGGGSCGGGSGGGGGGHSGSF